MPTRDLTKVASELESMAAELREQATAVDARAEAMDRRRVEFMQGITASLERLRAQAGLPAKDVRSALERDTART